jgi:hypothetical protein
LGDGQRNLCNVQAKASYKGFNIVIIEKNIPKNKNY